MATALSSLAMSQQRWVAIDVWTIIYGVGSGGVSCKVSSCN